jgi:uncharacterized protein
MNPTHIKILAFFALSCALAWSGNLGNYLWPSDNWPVPMNPLAPLLAAPIVISLTTGRAGLKAWWRQITRFRAPGWVYATSFLVPLAIIAASFGLTVALGADLAPLPRVGLAEVLVTIALVVLLFGPMEEEVSFRGYGLVEMERTMSPMAASLWIGFGVMVWHLPLLLTGDLPWTVLLPLAGVSVVYGWLFKSGGSVWPLVILHGQLNCVSSLVTGPMMPDRADQAIYLAILGVFYLAWAALIALVAGPSLTGRRASRRADPGLPMPL